LTDFKSKTEAEWKEQLTPEQFEICRKKGTERPFSGEYVKTKTRGTYHCLCCGKALFLSETKFDSGPGWPSFTDVLGDDNVSTQEDLSLSMQRTEVVCRQCDAHLGHVFEDVLHQQVCVIVLILFRLCWKKTRNLDWGVFFCQVTD